MTPTRGSWVHSLGVDGYVYSKQEGKRIRFDETRDRAMIRSHCII